MWRVLISLVTAVGALFVARTYTQEPTRTPVAAGTATRAGGLTAEEHAPDHEMETAPQPGWSRPKPEIIPRATYWPILFGGGIAFIFWGIISDVWMFGAGLILAIASIIGWINDLLNE
ncbi:MAG: cytochrome c oxidase subunit 4 [Chloroflexota bacterium]|nr:cytochrome c oxidase subunit 4 [Chloroflexota bacterium]